MSASYVNFAYYYDQLIDDAFYQAYVKRIDNINKFKNIIDLGCGSGRLCFMLKRADNEVSGVDLSAEMLMMAQNYNLEHQCGVYFFNENLTQLTLNKNYYDLVTCTLDTLNYIEGLEHLKKIFATVYDALEEGGYFMFDVLTPFYIDQIVNDYTQTEKLDTFEYVWHVEKVAISQIKHQLKIDDVENEYYEEHFQYIYTAESLNKLLKDVGFEQIDVSEAYNELDSSQAARLYFTCVKER